MGMSLREKGWGVNIDKLIVFIEVRSRALLGQQRSKVTLAAKAGGCQSRQGRHRFLLGRAGIEQKLTHTTANF